MPELQSAAFCFILALVLVNCNPEDPIKKDLWPECCVYSGVTYHFSCRGCETLLTAVPSDLPPETRTIDLSHNAITSLSEQAFGELPDLHSVTLNDNGIWSVNSQAFDGLPSLQYLDLERNSLSAIPSALPPTLKRLGLRKNLFTSLNPQDMPPMPSLEYLSVTTEELGANALFNLVSLNTIDIDVCSIRGYAFRGAALETINLDNVCPLELDPAEQGLILDTFAFAEYPGNEVHLTNNKLTLLPFWLFYNMPNVTRIQLSNNGLTSFSQLAFDDCPKLEEIIIEHNTETTANIDIQQDTFSRLPSLRNLYIEDMYITKVATGVFSDMSALRQLSLGSNQLTTLVDSVIEDIEETASTVYLNSNPWNCDCDLLGLLQIIERSTNLFGNRADTTCSEPEELSGTRLDQIDLEEFEC